MRWSTRSRRNGRIPRRRLKQHPRWPRPLPAPAAQSGSMFPVLGRAMLGIAGAYVLRAVAETSSLPRLAVACAGIAYAFLWLAWAARVRGGPLRFTSSIYAGTSALILAPMLWELTLRFKVLPAAIAAGVVLRLCACGVGACGIWPHPI